MAYAKPRGRRRGPSTGRPVIRQGLQAKTPSHRGAAQYKTAPALGARTSASLKPSLYPPTPRTISPGYNGSIGIKTSNRKAAQDLDTRLPVRKAIGRLIRGKTRKQVSATYSKALGRLR